MVILNYQDLNQKALMHKTYKKSTAANIYYKIRSHIYHVGMLWHSIQGKMASYKYTGSKGGLQKIWTQLQLNTYGHEYGISLLNEQNELVIKFQHKNKFFKTNHRTHCSIHPSILNFQLKTEIRS